MASLCRSYLESCHRQIFGIFEVQKVRERGASSDRLLALTDAFICYFKDTVKDKSFPWTSLSYISLDDNIILLEFGSEDKIMRFIPENIKKVKEIIGCIIQRVLTTYESEDLELKNFTTYKYDYTPDSLLARLYCSAIQSNMMDEVNNNQNIIEFAKNNLFRKKQKVVKIRANQIDKLATPIMKTLQSADYIESLEFVEPMNFDIFKILGEFISDDFPPKHIQVTGKLTANFQHFIDEINESKKLIGLTFKDCDFTQENIQTLENIRNSSLKSLSLQNCLQGKYEFTYAQSSLFTNLKTLNMDYTKALDFERLYENCAHIQILSVAYCNLDISMVLTQISKYPNHSIKMLNVSGNTCTELKSKDLNLPQALIRFDAADINWPEMTFIQVLDLFLTSNFPYGIYLNFSNSTITENDANKINVAFKNIPTRCLYGLDWSYNQISGNFNKFISRCDNLHELAVSGCYSSSNSEDLIELGNSLAKLQYIEKIIMAGTEEKHIGVHAASFINNLSAALQINTLNLSNQKLNQQSINILFDLVYLNRNLSQISFKGFDASIEGIFSSMKRFEYTKRTIFVDDFTDDINSAATTPQTKQIAKNLFELIGKLLKGGINEGRPENFEEPFNENPFVWVMEDFQRFPYYLSEEVEKTLSRPLLLGMAVNDKPQKFSYLKEAGTSDDEVHMVMIRRRMSTDSGDEGGRRKFKLKDIKNDDSSSFEESEALSMSRSDNESSKTTKSVEFDSMSTKTVPINNEPEMKSAGIKASSSMPSGIITIDDPKKPKRKRKSAVIFVGGGSKVDSSEGSTDTPLSMTESKFRMSDARFDNMPTPHKKRRRAKSKMELTGFEEPLPKKPKKAEIPRTGEKKKRRSVQFSIKNENSQTLFALTSEFLQSKKPTIDFPIKPIELQTTDTLKLLKETYSLKSLCKTIFRDE